MDMKHIQPFLDALDGRVLDQLGEHFSDDVVLKNPFMPDPFTGRDKVVGMLKVLRSAIDTFETTDIIADDRRAAVIVRIRAGEAEVTGVDVMTVDEDGLIDSMTIQFRPLAAVVAIQQKLAPLIGIPALELVRKTV